MKIVVSATAFSLQQGTIAGIVGSLYMDVSHLRPLIYFWY